MAWSTRSSAGWTASASPPPTPAQNRFSFEGRCVKSLARSLTIALMPVCVGVGAGPAGCVTTCSESAAIDSVLTPSFESRTDSSVAGVSAMEESWRGSTELPEPWSMKTQHSTWATRHMRTPLDADHTPLADPSCRHAFDVLAGSVHAAATAISVAPIVDSAPTFASVKTGPVAKTAVAKNRPNVKAHDVANAITRSWRQLTP